MKIGYAGPVAPSAPAERPDAAHGNDPPRNLVFIADGTFSSLAPGRESNAGLLLGLLAARGPRADQLYSYDPGIQGQGLMKWFNAATGMGINLTICAGYAFLASRYRPGDRIFLFGYSRGAYAVRSLAGMLDGIGLLRAERATHRNVRTAFRLYERGAEAGAFARDRCHPAVKIEMLGVWDTVKALGLPYPILSRLAGMASEFHDHALGGHIRHGYHAMAIDEDRTAFAPLLWERSPGWQGRLEQAWFPGCHGDVGGELRGRDEARPLANIPLTWMLRRAARHGLILPEGWESRFPEDAAAPSVGNRSGINRLFLLRAPRVTGTGDGEVLHLSIRERTLRLPGYRPVGRIEGAKAEAPTG